MDRQIADIRKNAAEIIRVSLTEFRGHHLIDIRVFMIDGDDVTATKKGVCCNVALLPQLLEALHMAASATEGADGKA